MALFAQCLSFTIISYIDRRLGSSCSGISSASSLALEDNIFSISISSVFCIFSLLVALCYANFIVTDQDVRLMLTLLAFALIFNEPFSVIANFYQATTNIGIVVAIRLAALLLRAFLVSVAVLFSSHLIIYSTRAIEAMLLAVSLSCVIHFRGGIWDWHKKVAMIMLNRGGALGTIDVDADLYED